MSQADESLFIHSFGHSSLILTGDDTFKVEPLLQIQLITGQRQDKGKMSGLKESATFWERCI